MKTTLTIIIALLALLLMHRECSSPVPQPQAADTIRITHTVYDSVLITREIPRPYPVEKLVVKEIPADVDTLQILRDYYATIIYNRILLDDTTALIRIIDTVHQNRLQGSQLYYRNRQPVTVFETYIIHPPDLPKMQLFAGGFVTGNANTLGAGPAVSLKTSRETVYLLGYDALNKSALISIQLPIKRRP